VESFSDFENIVLNIDSIISLQRNLLSTWLEEGFISSIEFDTITLTRENFVMYPHGINF